MARNSDPDYFSHKGSFDMEVEDREPAVDQRISANEGSQKATLPTPLYTPPALHSLPNSSQPTYTKEESSATPSTNDVLDPQPSPSETGSTNNTRPDRKASSPTPKLHIDTNLKPGSFSINSQTTPYSDATLFSVSDSGPNYALKMKLEDPSPKNRPRSRSEPPKPLLPPPSSKPPGSQTQRVPVPDGLRPQPSVAPLASATANTPHILQTPATPAVLSRSASRRKHRAFIANNPFTTHSHPDVVPKNEKKKQDLTFDQIRTPIMRMTPRVAFAPRNEDGEVFPSSRHYLTPIRSYQHPSRSQLERSTSERGNVGRNETSVRPNATRRSSSLRVDSTYERNSNRRDSVFSNISAASDFTDESTTALESRSDVQDDTLSNNVAQKSPYPMNRRREPFSHEDDLYDDDKDKEDSISITQSSFPRQDTLESSSGYSNDDDLEKKGDRNEVSGLAFKSKEAFVSWTIHFVGSTLPRQLYLHFLLRLPLLYFSRVSRIFEEADLTLPEIKRMALETPQSGNKLKLTRLDLFDVEAADIPLEYQSLSATWEFFIDSLLREWKVINIVSGLLLSAILTLLQIDGAASNPFIRFTSLFSLICALISLLYGCMYIIRFGTMRKPYKAAEWALEARNKAMIWWNVWVLLAMPAIWLTWSIILYIVCIMVFAWQTTSQVDANPSPLSPNVLLGVRVLLSVVLGLGIFYGALIITTFSRYGEVMDRTWKQRIDQWAEDKALAAASEYSDPTNGLPDNQTTYPSDRKPDAVPVILRSPSSSSHPSPDSFVPILNGNDNRIYLPPPHGFSGANLGKKPSLSKEKRRVRFESPKDSPAESLGESLAFDAESEAGEASWEAVDLDSMGTPSDRGD